MTQVVEELYRMTPILQIRQTTNRVIVHAVTDTLSFRERIDLLYLYLLLSA